jgi:hypothetical protein
MSLYRRIDTAGVSAHVEIRMSIEFRIRVDQLKRSARQLQINRDAFKDADVVYLIVSPTTLDIQAVGTTDRIVADGKQPGSGRLPLKVFMKMVDMVASQGQRECTVLIDDGSAKVGRQKTSHPDITVSGDLSRPLSIPPNASALDTLAVASMMTMQQIADAGMRERVQFAQRRASAAVAAATEALREFGVTVGNLTEILDRRVAEAAEIIRVATKSED